MYSTPTRPLLSKLDSKSKSIGKKGNRKKQIRRTKGGKDPLAKTSKRENEIDVHVFHLYGLTEEEMLTVLNSFSKMSIVEKTEIQNFYRDLERGNLK